MKKLKQKRTGISPFLIIFLLTLIMAVLVWRGWGYYWLSLNDKVDHPDYRTLKSTGDIGYGYGVAGTFLIFTNLLYLARRKFAFLNFGSMKAWLDLHVFTGLAGALFISFHSAFQARTGLAMTTAGSLAIVVITGLVGRYLYMLTPSTNNRELTELLSELEADLPGVAAQVTTAIKALPSVKPELNPSLWHSLRTLPFWRRTAGDRESTVELILMNHASMASVHEDRRALVDAICKRTIRSAGSQVRGVAATAFLRSWRSLHRFFAILMLLTVVFHISVAWYYGYRWFFSA